CVMFTIGQARERAVFHFAGGAKRNDAKRILPERGGLGEGGGPGQGGGTRGKKSRTANGGNLPFPGRPPGPAGGAPGSGTDGRGRERGGGAGGPAGREPPGRTKAGCAGNDNMRSSISARKRHRDSDRRMVGIVSFKEHHCSY